jgi:hypothetical protein
MHRAKNLADLLLKQAFDNVNRILLITTCRSDKWWEATQTPNDELADEPFAQPEKPESGIGRAENTNNLLLHPAPTSI